MTYFPSHLQIEVVAGICSADCIMCTIKECPRKGFLSMTDYAVMLEKFESHTDKLQYLTLHGMGEPLLDKTLAAKVALAKDKGFRGVGFATNGTHLTPEKTEALLDSGLDTIIFSLDGITKQTHERIRRGVDYDQILENVLHFIDRRNARGGSSGTKVIVRMIRQETNQHEWEEYKTFWNDRLSSAYGDQVSAFDIHNWGVREDGKRDDRLKELTKLSQQTKMICPDLLNRMIVFLDGSVALCCGDEKGVHNLGNILQDDPISIYNGKIFSQYRYLMSEGRLTDIDYCKNCQIILSRTKKQYLEIQKRQNIHEQRTNDFQT